MYRTFCFLFAFLISLVPLQAQFSPIREDNSISLQLDGMYIKGLHYLMSSQNEKGCWDGPYGDEPGVVGFALMAFLAHGDDPNNGPYATSIRKSLGYILDKQNKFNGYIGQGMYSHGFATLALAEAYGVVDDNRIGPALRKAVDLILSSQENNPLGSWRYSPDTNDADTTVCGCQMMALFAAKNAGIAIPAESFEKAFKYMYTCRTASGSYGYVNPQEKRITLTAIGSLVQSIGKKRNDPYYKKTLDVLKNNINYRGDTYMFYHEYYMSQALFHGDEETWKVWNDKNIKILSASQTANGSWVVAGNGCPAYFTSLALLSLAINYRYLPIYEK